MGNIDFIKKHILVFGPVLYFVFIILLGIFEFYGKVNDLWITVYFIITIGSGGYLFGMLFLHFRNKQKDYGLFHVIFAITIGLLVTVFVSVQYEYVPKSYVEYYSDKHNMSVIIDAINPSIVPIRSILNPIYYPITVTVKPYDEHIEIDAVRVFPSAMSSLNQESPTLNLVSNNTSNKIYKTHNSIEHDGYNYSRNVSYVADITYLNNDENSSLYHNQIPFNLSIINNDLTLLTYFWIVLIGVITSRFIDLVLNEVNQISLKEKEIEKETDPNKKTALEQAKIKLENNILKIDTRESLWIIFSFIISILLFALFKESIETFTDSIMINISIAFGFGFTFDRSLDLASRFKPLSTN